MKHYTDVKQAQQLFECLAAPARMEILRLVLGGDAPSLDYIAKTLHLTNGAITQHVKKMEDAGIIKLIDVPGKRGAAKRPIPALDRVIIDIAAELESESEQTFDLPLGSFSSANVKPYCALASTDGWIGERDDPRYFTYPERSSAALIYFNSGKIGWTLPSPGKRPLKSLSVSFEISSKPYGHGRQRQSTAVFSLNDIELGGCTIDGEFTDRKGLFTPSGFDGIAQYGKYKTISVREDGSYFDGIKIGSATVDSLNPSALVFYVSTDSGLALFGSGYGDYDCGIKVRLEYK
ncbi:MAG: helix-turn-helix domain-containing protein [Clostridiales bacterium]|nr:helix-turn-helix domain-containing protein [Clostridiales bacterium]